MPTILLKKSDTPGSVPGTANLTNLAGGAEVAVNTADKRMFSMTSASAVIELGTNPSSLTCADASFTVARVGSLTISSLSLTNATVTSATVTTLTGTSANITNISGTSLTVSTATLSAGTANGVLYLNGSKVATSGSALTFNGTALGVGTSTNNTNYLAVGGAVSVSNNYGTALLSVASNSFTGVTLASHENTAGANGTYLGLMRSRGTQASPTNLLSGDLIGSISGQVFNTAGAAPYRMSCAVSLEADGNQASGDLPGRIVFSTVPAGSITLTERMRLDSSGNLGIGTTSPSYKLHVVGGAAIANRTTSDTPGNISLGVLSTSSVATFGWRTDTSNNLHFDIYNGASWSAALTTSLAGNLGLGVTPSAWGSGWTAFQLSASGAALSGRGSTSEVYLSSNAHYNGSNWIYKLSATAAYYGQDSGVHKWYTAPSGTAGNAITFTQAATLDANGTWLVGTATVPAGATSANKYSVVKGSTEGVLVFGKANTGGGAITGNAGAGIVFYTYTGTDGSETYSERARITAGGALAVGLTTPTFPDGNGIHLNNSSGAARFHVTNNTTGTTATDGSEFTVAGSDLYIINNESATMQFWTNGTERARIDSSGNVGIGTASPGDLLQVNRGSGSGITSGIALTTAAGGVGDGSYIKWTGAVTAEKIARIDGVQEGTDLGSIRFNTGNGADGFAERMRITAAGNISAGAGALATTATDGFLYVPTCAGTPTGTPTAITGMAPIVVNTTNNKLYFYSGGAWRDAGP